MEAFENQNEKIPTVDKYETVISVQVHLYTNIKLLKIQLVYSPMGKHKLYVTSMHLMP